MDRPGLATGPYRLLPIGQGLAPRDEADGVKDCAYPKHAGCVTSFEDKSEGLSLIVTLNVGRREVTRVDIAGLLCHEATHVWQAVRKNMAEDEPSKEFEAYAMQAIFQSLYQAWLDLCAPDELKARNAKRVKTND